MEPEAQITSIAPLLKRFSLAILFPIFWMVLQAIPLPFSSLANPIWSTTSIALNEASLPGRISVDPGATLRTLIFYLINVSVVVATVIITKRSAPRRNDPVRAVRGNDVHVDRSLTRSARLVRKDDSSRGRACESLSGNCGIRRAGKLRAYCQNDRTASAPAGYQQPASGPAVVGAPFWSVWNYPRARCNDNTRAWQLDSRDRPGDCRDRLRCHRPPPGLSLRAVRNFVRDVCRGGRRRHHGTHSTRKFRPAWICQFGAPGCRCIGGTRAIWRVLAWKWRRHIRIDVESLSRFRRNDAGGSPFYGDLDRHRMGTTGACYPCRLRCPAFLLRVPRRSPAGTRFLFRVGCGRRRSYRFLRDFH